MRPIRYFLALSLLIGPIMAGCTPTQNVRGYFIDDVLISQIKPGVDNKGSVLNTLGSPSSVSTFGTNTWYYATRKTESLAFFEKKLLDQRVIAIKFDDLEMVSDVQRFNAEDGKAVQVSERVTPTRGKQITLFQQLFGNIGRFSTGEEE